MTIAFSSAPSKNITQFYAQEILWKFFHTPQSYIETIATMADKTADILQGAPEEIWVLEHDPILTMGTSATKKDFLLPPTLPVVQTGRGGKITYHGPGILIVYPLLNLSLRKKKDVRAYVRWIELWLTRLLKKVNIEAHGCTQNVGLWVQTPNELKKIAAIGVRIRRWVTSHGFALNVCPDLSYFHTIVPCGLQGKTITSIAEIKQNVSIEEVYNNLYVTYDSFS